MARRALAAVLAAVAVLLAGCATPRPPVALLPANVFGINVDNDVGAIDFARYAFADPARTRDNPIDGARAVIAVDYLADALYAPRWAGLSPLFKQQMEQARTEVRDALGIDPNAPSPAVVDGLLRAIAALSAGDQPAAAAALSPPVFRLGGDATLARLSRLPFLRTANIASQNVAQQRLSRGCLLCR